MIFHNQAESWGDFSIAESSLPALSNKTDLMRAAQRRSRCWSWGNSFHGSNFFTPNFGLKTIEITEVTLCFFQPVVAFE